MAAGARGPLLQARVVVPSCLPSPTTDDGPRTSDSPMAAPTRKQRLESLLHREIATIVQQQLRDPRIGFLTITRVEMSADLHLVTAYFTIFGDAKQRRLIRPAAKFRIRGHRKDWFRVSGRASIGLATFGPEQSFGA